MLDGWVDMLSPEFEAMPDRSRSSQGGLFVFINVMRRSFPSGFGHANHINTLNPTIKFCMFSMRMSSSTCIYLISIDGPQFIVDSDGNCLNLSLSDKKSGEKDFFLIPKSILRTLSSVISHSFNAGLNQQVIFTLWSVSLYI